MKKARNKQTVSISLIESINNHVSKNSMRIKHNEQADSIVYELVHKTSNFKGKKLKPFTEDTKDIYRIKKESSQKLKMRPLRQKKQNVRYNKDCAYEESKKTLTLNKKCKQKSRKSKTIQSPEKIKENSNKKKRNSERRKEKSRDAARCRRGKESEIFNDLGALLPLDGSFIASLDKASVIRVSTAFLRTRSLVTWGLNIPSEDVSLSLSKTMCETFLESEGILQALDGFLIVLTPDGEVVYTSENISTFLGISQIDVIGHSLLDYTHPCDHDEVRHLATLVTAGPNNTFLRFKCALTSKGKSVNLKNATYKVVQITGQVLKGERNQLLGHETSGVSSRTGNSWIVALGVPVPHPSNIEVPLNKQAFVSKHSLDMKFTYVDDNVKEFCGYRAEELMGQSLYQLNHALDTQLVKEAYKTLRSKGQVETGRYRFLSHGGGYVWVVTQATLISGYRDSKPQYVVCLNYVVSEVEFGDVIFSDCQLNAVQTKSSTHQSASLCSSSDSRVPCSVPQVILPCFPPPKLRSEPLDSFPSNPSPVAATCSLLTDRTEDMNEGYLTFADDDSHITILKEEPEDLTHLAPSVGEDFVPLEVPIFVPVFDDLLGADPDCFLSKQSNALRNECEEDSIEFLLNEPLTSHFQEREGPVKRSRLFETSAKSFYKKSFDSVEGTSLQFNSDQYNLSSHKVPEEGISSSHSSVVDRIGLKTPHPPFSPLLSQNASPIPQQKKKNVNGRESRPIAATSKLFAPLDEDLSTNSTMDLFTSFDLKLEEDLELRAPYIPPIDEVLAFDNDDLFGMSTATDNDTKDDLTSFGDKHSKDEGSSIQGRAFSINRSFQQNKHGGDTGGSFVDPNQVLPGQFYIKGEENDNLQELRYLLEAPPPSPVKEPVDPPPPLSGSGSIPSIMFIKTGSKRPLSPSGFTLTKRLRPSGLLPSSTTSGKVELPTPHAPLMQQLLVSKEPIRVRGCITSSTSASDGRPCMKPTSSPTEEDGDTHSVLRNLLVSGRDERAGYTVMTSSGDEDPNGGSDGDKTDSSDRDSPLHPINSFPLNKEGKIELTRQQLSDLLDRAGGFRTSFKGGSMPPTPPESFSPPTPATSMSDSSIEKPLLMLDSTMGSIPSLFDLTSFDCEVNAPAPDPGLLLGSELLMALEQTQ